MLDCDFCIHASKGPVIIMNQLKFIYNCPFRDSHLHPIHTCFPIITARKRSLEQGNIVRSVCQELFHQQEGGIPAYIAGGIPACLAGTQGDLQAHTQGGS